MSSSISSSNHGRSKGARIFALYALSALAILAIIGTIEFALHNRKAAITSLPVDTDSLRMVIPEQQISGREVGNQMLVHNLALFAGHPDPGSVRVGYVGTSRSKVLRPERFGLSNAAVGAGNSYGEISYGLLLQAEVMRLSFPNLRRMYIESSFLLRKPNRLILEPDHRKYLPLLQTLQPLCNEAGANAPCQKVFAAAQAESSERKSGWKPAILDHRSELRLSKLLPQSDAAIPVLSDPLLVQLAPNGERKALSVPLVSRESQLPEISNEHVKVQRLREVASNAPWDGLFDLFVKWGAKHKIEVVFFEPPVRSDLFRMKTGMGLPLHKQDLERIARATRTPYIDLNREGLGYIEDWSLFSDEDHLETCVGSGLLTVALEAGYKHAMEHGDIVPKLPRREVEAAYAERLSVCGAGLAPVAAGK